MPGVAASETGGAQTGPVAQPAGDAGPGLDARVGGSGRALAEGPWRSRTPLERATGAGESPVGDASWARVHPEREYRRTRGIRWEAGRPTAQG